MEKKELAVILAACVFDDEEEEDELPMKRRRIWTRDWVLRREQEGLCAKLLNELRAKDPALYRNCLRMTAKQFDDLLLRVTPHIQNQNMYKYAYHHQNRCVDTSVSGHWRQLSVSAIAVPYPRDNDFKNHSRSFGCHIQRACERLSSGYSIESNSTSIEYVFFSCSFQLIRHRKHQRNGKLLQKNSTKYGISLIA